MRGCLPGTLGLGAEERFLTEALSSGPPWSAGWSAGWSAELEYISLVSLRA